MLISLQMNAAMVLQLSVKCNSQDYVCNRTHKEQMSPLTYVKCADSLHYHLQPRPHHGLSSISQYMPFQNICSHLIYLASKGLFVSLFNFL